MQMKIPFNEIYSQTLVEIRKQVAYTHRPDAAVALRIVDENNGKTGKHKFERKNISLIFKCDEGPSKFHGVREDIIRSRTIFEKACSVKSVNTMLR